MRLAITFHQKHSIGSLRCVGVCMWECRDETQCVASSENMVASKDAEVVQPLETPCRDLVVMWSLQWKGDAERRQRAADG